MGDVAGVRGGTAGGPVLAVLTAAGSGTRLGCSGPKALVEIAGLTMVERAAVGLACAGVTAIVVTAPGESLAEFERVLPGAVPGFPAVPVVCVAGGDSRQASVAAGLAALPGAALRAGVGIADDTPVLVHDAARPLTPASAIVRVVAAVRSGLAGVVPALPVTDTLKRVGGFAVGIDAEPGAPGGGSPRGGGVVEAFPVVDTPDRSTLWAVQTPQGFPWSVLRRAHAEGAARASSESTAATDDAGLVEDLGLGVHVVRGDTRSLKVTTPLDLKLAELLLAETRTP